MSSPCTMSSTLYHGRRREAYSAPICISLLDSSQVQISKIQFNTVEKDILVIAKTISATLH